MRSVGFLFHLMVFGLAAWPVLVAEPAPGQQAVVVELFTSEGCSTCPPADAMISQLSKQRNSVKGIDLILLGEHVEYWNDQGWRDRFSAPVYTQRQYDYVHELHLATAYTPQIVVDGHRQTVGGNADAVKRLIAEAAQVPKPATATLEWTAPNQLHIQVTDTSAKKAMVFLAVTEDNLQTRVEGGENGGRTLKHDAVVRELQNVGAVTNGRFEKTVNLQSKNDWKVNDLRLIVLVQDSGSGEIQGAASIPFHATSKAASGN